MAQAGLIWLWRRVRKGGDRGTTAPPTWGKTPSDEAPWLAPFVKQQPDAMRLAILAVGGGLVR